MVDSKMDKLKNIKKPPSDFLYPPVFQTCMPKLKIEPKMMFIPVKPDFLAEFDGSALEILNPLNIDAIPNFDAIINSLNPIDAKIISDFCSDKPTTAEDVMKELKDIEKNILFGEKAIKFDQDKKTINAYKAVFNTF